MVWNQNPHRFVLSYEEAKPLVKMQQNLIRRKMFYSSSIITHIQSIPDEVFQVPLFSRTTGTNCLGVLNINERKMVFYWRYL